MGRQARFTPSSHFSSLKGGWEYKSTKTSAALNPQAKQTALPYVDQVVPSIEVRPVICSKRKTYTCAHTYTHTLVFEVTDFS